MCMDKKIYKFDEINKYSGDIAVKKLEYCIDEAEHTHEFVELVYISHGSAIHYINGACYEVKKGDLLFINYKQVHSFKVKENLNYYNICISPKLFSEELINSSNAFEMLSLSVFEEFRSAVTPGKPLLRFNGNEIIKIEFIISEMHKEVKGDRVGRNTILKSYLTVLLSYVFRKMAEEGIEAKGKYGHIHDEVLEFIAQNCNEKLNLEKLAERCFYNPSYFSRLFKDIYGISVTEYIQKERIEKSCYMLANSHRSIDEISLAVGYEDKTNFYKFFRKHCGMTPAEYRKKYRGNSV